MREIQLALEKIIKDTPVIDTHEHLPYSEERRERNTDILKEYLFHYMSSDLISAGLSAQDFKKVTDISLPIMERWSLVEKYWDACRYTGYGRALDIAVQGIYGINGIHANTLEELNEKFKASLSPGHFQKVLKDLCRIRLSILDCWEGNYECDRTLFRRVWQPGTAIFQFTEYTPFHEIVEYYDKLYHIRTNTLDDWMQIFDLELEDCLKNGIIALKCTVAYDRPLHFVRVGYQEAARSFNETLNEWRLKGSDPKEKLHFSTAVKDFMMHIVLKRANEKGLVMQFHTGLQEGNGNKITNSHPALMVNLFKDYPDMSFDLFHISYPYYMVAAAICKNFPNVFIDMCWAHMISPNASIQALSEFLDAVPYNKISAFGGDCAFVDGIYGHLQLARRNVSRVLAQKIQEGVFSFDTAVNIAHALFYDNPLRIFRLEKEIGKG